MPKILIAYFSVPEATNPENMTKDEANSVVVINGEVLGNTQYVANLIKRHTNADIFRIERKTPYPINHAALIKEAKKEQEGGVRPELAADVYDITQYDVIFLGYPNWWYDMPMPVYTFLEKHDFAGKRIIPFCTHGGSGFSDSVNTVVRLQPKAEVERNGYTVYRNDADQCENEIIAWLQSLSY